MSSHAEQLVHELCVNLEDQVRCWQRLLELSQVQMQALLAQDPHTVHQALQEIEVAMLDRARTEITRGRLMEAIASTLGVPPLQVTRALLVQVSSAPVAESLERAANALQVLVGELDRVVEKNKALLEHELAVIDTLVKGITVDRTARPTYQAAGVQGDAPRIRLLDAQV
jgi:hypothetical protein